MSHLLRSLSLLCASLSIGVIYLAIAAAPAWAQSPGCPPNTCVFDAQCIMGDCNYPVTFEYCLCIEDTNCGCAPFGA